MVVLYLSQALETRLEFTVTVYTSPRQGTVGDLLQVKTLPSQSVLLV